MKEETLTYTEAYTKLQEIVQNMEQGNISVDKLSSEVKRAMDLIRLCKQKLRETEESVDEILQELNQA